ncbi:AAA family ATPase [Marinicrinis lubricantis]|uniref:AAA family ATPase n=1 Tax=Marinicrinis lubricantis TaxID=2086470 RepID=A0ABW1IHA4_9BACL
MLLEKSFPLAEEPQALLNRVIDNVKKVYLGHDDVIEKLMIALLSGGHVLLEDVPGVGKTVLVRALASSIDGLFKRVQCTPDVMPSDLTGIRLFNQRKAEFEYRPGPLMCNVLLADELNRSSPRTQSALLEAMEEGQITVDGEVIRLPKPFFVLATQNPYVFEGTYSLPEAQLDRFMFKLQLGYPEAKNEERLLEQTQGAIHPVNRLKPVLLTEELNALIQESSKVHIDPSLRTYIVQLAEATRRHEDISLGVSPRASIMLMKASQACAFIRGRGFVLPDDIKELAPYVFAHRVLLRHYRGLEAGDAFEIMKQITRLIAAPGLKYVR